MKFAVSAAVIVAVACAQDKKDPMEAFKAMVQPGCDDFHQRTHVGVGCFLRFTTAASRDLRARGMTSSPGSESWNGALCFAWEFKIII